MLRRVDVNAFLTQKKKTSPANEAWWTEFENLYGKKLWHQLTMKLLDYVKRPEAVNENLVEMYENFIIDFETRMNPFYLVEIIAHVVRQKKDPKEALEFLTGIKNKVKMNQDASLLCSIMMCRIKLDSNDLAGVKAILEEISPLIDAETGVTPIHGRYFQLASDYHLLSGNHNEYYRNALRYLGCTNLASENVQDMKNRAFALSLAALLGDAVFNFGELLQHPVIEHVKTDFPWLYDLLFAFNSGNLAQFMALRPQWSKQPDLASEEVRLRQKISLLCLMELTFNSQNGILTFQEIANASQLPVNEVELLVMRALSLKLVKGVIDEVDKRVHLTWVQPRVLGKEQISTLGKKLDVWCREVRDLEVHLEQQAQDIIG